ncbi:hemolysin family protein [Anabaena sp. FACHB-709]|uniref:HlyC/CorC family transporter n=2 Tax=Nostocaceae TaxID=1162 RepID=A0ABR7ZF15_ANACY|nr:MULTISPECIES: hemolysin family protein [Nostocaceae]BAY70814.1 putative hemolysin [Trichormus variabilis NIES-23]HBW30509.1 HlyC/CorC family transporter [Nostoc sp. UBA8866]MBD2171222.1 HlyC/CorC family transporter [Anabaena cylindrica FACHB-318]MBD2263108.1 HlyC/CorC family transporter [Anabaena sp. FACHB-709]MBD2272549.1 HlyC/CorC family transporter [Nostoc sp. PCC 7120 = FACHB-418]
MSSITVEILIILVLIVANGIFSMSEMAIVSARKVRLQQLANQGDPKAKAALKLAESPNNFLSTVQIGISLIGILTGAFGGATIASRLAVYVRLVPFLTPYSEPVSFGIVVLIITYLSLIIGELVPKRLALNSPERIAAIVAIPMRALATLASPAVHLLSASTDMVLRIMGITPSLEPQVTEEEIKILIEQGTEAGTFEEAEQDMVERVFRLGDRPVSSFMTPRPDIVWLDLEDTTEENRQKMSENGYSRYPVCQGGLDNVLGIIPVTDLLARSLRGDSLDLTVGLRQPVFVPESTRGLKVLELFKQTITHMALVVDEYGVIQGLVTLNDIMSEIVGDVPSADGEEDPQAVQREDGSWLLDGMLAVEEFFELFGLEEWDFEERGSYQTLGGFVITHLGRIPAAADHFEWQGMRIEVMDMDGNRVDKVLVVPTKNKVADTQKAD